MPAAEVLNRVKGYRRLIPSMTALLEFEAVARLSSFTLAARELGVTQAAVSKQIKLLEEVLGVKLFHRLHRSIRLTSEGYVLFTVTAESMQKIAGAFDKIAAGTTGQELVLTTTAAFSHFRILPRLGRLRVLQPNLQLRLTTQMFTSELRHHDIDLSVRYGSGKWDDGAAIHLFGEEVFPVCSPAWLAIHQAPTSLEELFQAELIDSDPTSEGWMTWQSWFKALAGPTARRKYNLRFSLYTDTIQAALFGQGIALGWSGMLDHLLASGDLIRLTPYAVKTQESHYLVVPNGHPVTPTVQVLVEWLQATAQVGR
ncbi:LysR family transcriptional regulator [Pseudomonas sp. Leaf127]|uniref:LysR substrate-binding domain-containing protein n=1 Tax=Pseudomonas sp. Leaf127 TaxID=1736267 RepID=UPI0007025E3B|nr:LysR substrate-binding domain-containing protein [Pseudomonas sp. Leaf127]KQQ53582.1 LysR family transcriptional regulator [Pseudomonas sp. Leaf127]